MWRVGECFLLFSVRKKVAVSVDIIAEEFHCQLEII